MIKMMNKKKPAQILEYSVIISLVIAALIAFPIYFKRAVQGRLKEATDSIGSQFSPRYSRGYTEIIRPVSVRETTEYNEEEDDVITRWEMLGIQIEGILPYVDDFSGVGLNDEELFE